MAKNIAASIAYLEFWTWAVKRWPGGSRQL